MCMATQGLCLDSSTVPWEGSVTLEPDSQVAQSTLVSLWRPAVPRAEMSQVISLATAPRAAHGHPRKRPAEQWAGCLLSPPVRTAPSELPVSRCSRGYRHLTLAANVGTSLSPFPLPKAKEQLVVCVLTGGRGSPVHSGRSTRARRPAGPLEQLSGHGGRPPDGRGASP